MTTDYGRMERIATAAEDFQIKIEGEWVNVGAVIRALYTDHRRLKGDVCEKCGGSGMVHWRQLDKPPAEDQDSPDHEQCLYICDGEKHRMKL